MTSNNNRGSILVYSLMVMSIMLAIGLSLNAIFVLKLKRANVVGNANKAIYAADSASEMCLYEARHRVDDELVQNAGTDYMDLIGTDGAKVKIEGRDDDDGSSLIVVTEDCRDLDQNNNDSFSFSAAGTYQNSQRRLEISQ